MFAELHTHNDNGSNLRLIDTTIKVEAAIDHAVSIGLAGMAVTDHESLSSHIRAMQYCKKYPDFKMVFGNEIYLINEDEYQNTNRFFHFILLAKDLIGHRQLRELSTRAWSRIYSHKNVRRVPTFYSDIQEIIGSNPGHMIAMTACLGGFFPALVLAERNEEAVGFAKWCAEVFGADNFYVEFQPGIAEEQVEFNKRALKLCKEHGFNWTITNDVHYLTKDKRELHAAYLNSKDEDRETSSFYENTYFKTEDEMRERLTYFDEADTQTGFDNTIKILNAVETYTLQQETHVPPRELPEFEVRHVFKQWYNKCPSLEAVAYSIYDQDRFCLAECEKGALALDRPIDEALAKRLDIEFEQLLDISEKKNLRLCSYYNLVQLLVELMWDVSYVGPGRGSAGSWEIAYLMGIIQIEPMQWDLPWWRHICKERPELPRMLGK